MLKSPQVINLRRLYKSNYFKGWISANERLDQQLSNASAQLKESQMRVEEVNRQLQDTMQSRRQALDSTQRLSSELLAVQNLLAQKDKEWIHEKEMRIKLELDVAQLNRVVEMRDEEVGTLKKNMAEMEENVKEFTVMKKLSQETKSELEKYVKNENLYLDELRRLEEMNKKYLAEKTVLTSLNKKLTGDIDMLKVRETSLSTELDHLKSQLSTDNQKSDQINSLLSQNQTLQSQITQLEARISSLQIENKEFSSRILEKENEIQQIQIQNTTLIGQNETLNQDYTNCKNQHTQLQSELLHVAQRLEAEVQSKKEIRELNKDKLIHVSDKINDLQTALTQTQRQMAEFRQVENTLHLKIKDRDETIQSLQAMLQEQERVLIEAQAEIAKERYLTDALKASKKDELMMVQEKFIAAKEAMEKEIVTLSSQLSSRNCQAGATVDELAKLKIRFSEISADKFRVEAKVSELIANESSHLRHVAKLEEQLRMKDVELKSILSKHSNIMEQVKKFDAEIQPHDSSLSNTTFYFEPTNMNNRDHHNKSLSLYSYNSK